MLVRSRDFCFCFVLFLQLLVVHVETDLVKLFLQKLLVFKKICDNLMNYNSCAQYGIGSKPLFPRRSGLSFVVEDIFEYF